MVEDLREQKEIDNNFLEEEMKNHNYILRLVAIALFAAIILLSTLLSIPNGVGGYIHPGDSMIYACAWFLGGPLAAIAAAVGSGLADIIAGYPQFAIITLLIKGIMGLVVGFAMSKLPKKMLYRVLSMSIGAVIMIVGYFVATIFLYGIAAAFTETLFNLIQAVTGVILGTLIIEALRKVNGINNFRNKLKGKE